MDLKAFIRDVPDFPKPGILFKDITPLLGNPRAFQTAIDLLIEKYRNQNLQGIAAAEARGFLFAAPMALALKVPLIPLRKPGKLPYHTISKKYDLEYGTAELHMHIDGIQKRDRILLVDDLLATGGTMKAGGQLIEQAGGIVAGCAFIVELSFLPGRELLKPYDLFSLITY